VGAGRGSGSVAKTGGGSVETQPETAIAPIPRINERLGKLAPMWLAVEQLVLLLVWISLVMRLLFVDFFDLFQARQP
tara:strand:+ start:431 stop:661 length:231 start_codon:yes stop_codon:yes gene_type:complete